MVGTNAKMNEIQALMGISVLEYLDEAIHRRKQVSEMDRNCLSDVPGIRFVPAPARNAKYNYVYMPVEVEEKEFGMGRDNLYEKLKQWNICARRYFYPLVCDFQCYRDNSVKNPLLHARRLADRILTLPVYDSLQLADVE